MTYKIGGNGGPQNCPHGVGGGTGIGIGGGMIGGPAPGVLSSPGTIGGTIMTGLGTTTGTTVTGPATTIGIGKISRPGDMIGGGVTTIGVPDLVVVKGGGFIGRIGVGGGRTVHGMRQDTVGFGTSHIHGGKGITFDGVSSEPGRLSPVHPTMVPRKPSILSTARMSDV